METLDNSKTTGASDPKSERLLDSQKVNRSPSKISEELSVPHAGQNRLVAHLSTLESKQYKDFTPSDIRASQEALNKLGIKVGVPPKELAIDGDDGTLQHRRNLEVFKDSGQLETMPDEKLHELAEKGTLSFTHVANVLFQRGQKELDADGIFGMKSAGVAGDLLVAQRVELTLDSTAEASVIAEANVQAQAQTAAAIVSAIKDLNSLTPEHLHGREDISAAAAAGVKNLRSTWETTMKVSSGMQKVAVEYGRLTGQTGSKGTSEELIFITHRDIMAAVDRVESILASDPANETVVSVEVETKKPAAMGVKVDLSDLSDQASSVNLVGDAPVSSQILYAYNDPSIDPHTASNSGFNNIEAVNNLPRQSFRDTPVAFKLEIVNRLNPRASEYGEKDGMALQNILKFLSEKGLCTDPGEIGTKLSETIGSKNQIEKLSGILDYEKSIGNQGFEKYGFDELSRRVEDGTLHPTQLSLISFQKAAGITQDAVPGPETYQAMIDKIVELSS